MKILHTADWHLGKRLNFFSRIDEQREVLDEICQIAENENPDLVIVAGDLFDAFNPSTEAVELLYKTLKRLTNNDKRPVVAIAGNHDSPDRIDAPDILARESGIFLIGYPKTEVKPIDLLDFYISKSVPGLIEFKINHLNYPVRILHTAYANEIRLKEFFGEDKDKELNQVLRENWQNLADEYCDESGVNLLTAHLYMMNKGGEIIEEPDGEKPLKIGNASMIYSESVPSQIQYTALGHLHGFRNVGTEKNPIVYSSSPLQYSFSESGQQKYVVMVEAEPGKQAKISKIPLQKGKELHRKTFDNIEKAVEWLEENTDTLVELTMISDTYLTNSEQKRLNTAHPNIIHLIPKVENTDSTSSEFEEIDLSRDIQLLFKDYFKSKNEGQEPNNEIMELFNEIFQK